MPDDKLKELKKISKKRINQPVLIVAQSIEDIGPKYSYFMPSERDTSQLVVRTEKKLAILTEEVDLNRNGNVIFPCNRYVHKEEHDKWIKHPGPIKLEPYKLMILGNVLDEDNLNPLGLPHNIGNNLEKMMKSREGLEIVFGKKDVERHFLEGHKITLGDEKRPIADYSYFAAMKMLGRKVPDKFRQGYADFEAERQAMRILENIRELREKGRKTAEYIHEVESHTEKGIYYFDDGDRTSEIPAKQHLAPHRRHLDEIRQDIMANLQEALDWQLFGLGIKLRDRARVIDVDLELKILAEGYGFMLPK